MSSLEVVLNIPNIQIQCPSQSRVVALSETSVSPDYVSFRIGWPPAGKLLLPCVKKYLRMLWVHSATSAIVSSQFGASSEKGKTDAQC